MIDFMKYRFLYLIISLAVLLPGIYSLVRFGLQPGIDFTGGTVLEIKIKNQKSKIKNEDVMKITQATESEFQSVQSSEENTFLLKLKPIDNRKKQELLNKFKEKYEQVEEIRFETVGPILGKELLQKTFIAAFLAIVAILLYIAWAFKNVRFGVSAIVALLHDLLVVVGMFAILGRVKGVEVDSLFVTAVLTTMSFSVHDTIVVFDRVREMQKKHLGSDFGLVINQALTETMVRSVNNSLTIIFMLLALFLLGGETTKWFVLALLIGTISGTYSSPFVATPILYTWYKLRKSY